MDIQSSDYQHQLQQATDPSLRLAERYRILCANKTTRDDLTKLVARFPARYGVFAYLLDCPGWDNMSELHQGVVYVDGEAI